MIYDGGHLIYDGDHLTYDGGHMIYDGGHLIYDGGRVVHSVLVLTERRQSSEQQLHHVHQSGLRIVA